MLNLNVKLGFYSAMLLIGLLTGCASKTAEKNQYSGFLNNYSDLKHDKTATNHETLRWISADYHEKNYSSIYLMPVVFYPHPTPNSRVSAATLEQVRLYTESRFKQALAKRKPLTATPKPGSLIVKIAITAVTAENKDMQFYEVVPVAAVLASTMAATGHRTQNSELFIEAEVIDASSNQPVIKVIRKGLGKTVPNSSAPITAADVKDAIDDMVKDIVAFPTR